MFVFDVLSSGRGCRGMFAKFRESTVNRGGVDETGSTGDGGGNGGSNQG